MCRQPCGRPARAARRLGTAVACLLLLGDPAQAVTINLTFGEIGSDGGNTAGGGLLQDIARAAANTWERAIFDAHTVTIDIRWGAQASALAAHALLGQGGIPNRETSARIVFDNDGSTRWFADTNPLDASEFSVYTESGQDRGGGLLNTGRVFSGAMGLAAGRFDLYSVALHEIGHALGLSASNRSFIAENADGDIDVTGPLPFAGSVLPTVSGAHLDLPTALMFPSISSGTRRVISEADLLANAQISRFTQLNLNPNVIPEPATLALAAIGIAFAAGLHRHRRGSAA